jgi:predicted AAA+ superfamily ATPase
LITAVASRVGSLLNVADLSRTLDAPATTIRRYIHLLEAIFLTQSLPAWSINTDTRVIKSPRLFFTDTGLLAHQIQVSGQSVLDKSFQFGRLLENFVITELRKQMGWSRAARSMSYYRTQEGTEVDIVLEGAGGKVVGIEIKAASTLNKKDFKGLQHLSDKLGSRFLRGIVLYTGEEQLPFGPKMYCMPVSALWAG